jgi:hypothetical protein
MSQADAPGIIPIAAPPLLQTLGDADAAVCTDGFCAVPEPQTTEPQTTGADE